MTGCGSARQESKGSGNDSSGSEASPGDRHPADDRIREIVSRGHSPQPADLQLIRDRMSTAPFSHQILSVPAVDRGLMYQVRAIQPRDDAAFVHLVRWVVKDGQWAMGTTITEYVEDLHSVVRDSATRIVVYDFGRGPVAAAFGPNATPAERRGINPEHFAYVVYSADRSCIITGYQVSGLSSVSIPKDAQWLT